MANQEQVTTFRIKDFWTDSMKKIMSVNDRFESQIKGFSNKVGGGLENVKSKLHAFKIKHMDAISDIAGEIPGASRAITLLSNPYVALGTVVVGAGVAIKNATEYAEKWEAKLAEANVTAKLTKSELKGLSDQLLKTAGSNVGQFMDVPATFNNLLSADLSVQESLIALEPSLRAAKAGFTDAATAASAGVGVMNSSGESITRVFDILFATVDKGAAEFKDIAQYLPKIIPNARAAGLALDETAGAWAFLTSQGVKSEQATTLMENAIKVLSTKDRINDFNKLGVAIFDQKGKMLPLTQIIEQLAGKLDGLTDKQRIAKLAGLGMDQQASTAFNLMVQDVDKLKGAIDTTINSSGAADQAYKDAAQSGDNWAIVGNKMREIWVKFGNLFLPMLEKTGEWTLDIINWFEELNRESFLWNDILSALSWVFEVLWDTSKAVLTGIWSLIVSINDTINLFIPSISDTGESFEDMYLKARPYIVWVAEMLNNILDVCYEIISLDFSGAWSAIKNFEIPSIDKITSQQNSEVSRLVFDKIVDASLPGRSLNPGNKHPYSGLDLNGIGDDKNKSRSGGGISGGGGTKTITINIQQLLPGMTVNATSIKEAAGDIGRLIQEELVKMISDSTLAIE